ncbi:MAG: tetraacyldisaccharide 4'-kinase [Candidatus Binataceae bacterium]
MYGTRPGRSMLERLWETPLPPSRWPLWLPLAPAAAIFTAVTSVRNRWWRGRARAAGLPVISVGNLTVGGSGKTPFTLFLAASLMRQGFAVGIVSRGWGRADTHASLVSDGTRVLLSPREAGDEPVMMAKRFAGPIAVARRRLEAITLLTTRFKLDAVILDDGFQHVRLRRDLDLVMVGTSQRLNNWPLPAGPMRERPRAIRRADAVIMIDSERKRAKSLQDYARWRGRPLFRASIRPRALIHEESGHWTETALALNGMRVVAVSGLANPRAFHQMLEGCGADVRDTLDYPDHHDYGPADWENILDAANGSDALITTEKDLVKLERFSPGRVPMYALRLQVEMESYDEMRLFETVIARIRDTRRF